MPQETLEWSSTVSDAFDATIDRVANDDNNFAVSGTTGQFSIIEFGDMIKLYGRHRLFVHPTPDFIHISSKINQAVII